MTAATRVRCDFCSSDVPAGETFEPYRGAIRCMDAGACERRQIRAHDPSILPDEEMPVPPAAPAAPGAVCALCGASEGALYERVPRSGQWMCRDQAGCEQRSVEVQYLRAWSDSSPDRLISSADMRAMTAAARPEIPPERAVLDPTEIAALAAAETLGRKRQP